MAEYVYRGLAPVPDENGELLHPLDVREHGTPPDCPPWEPLGAPEAEAPGLLRWNGEVTHRVVPGPPGAWAVAPPEAMPEPPTTPEPEAAAEEDAGDEPGTDLTPERM